MAIALGLVALTMGAQIGEAGVVHVQCIEHGQLVHLHAADRASATERATDGDLLGSRTARGLGDDEHCAFVGLDHCVAIAASAPVVSVLSAPAVEPAAILISPVSRAIFRFAPKTSPPA